MPTSFIFLNISSNHILCYFFAHLGISELLQAPGKLPNNFGTRNLSDNISDLKAQVAANRKGALLMQELVKEYGLVVVQAYMEHIQACAGVHE